MPILAEIAGNPDWIQYSAMGVLSLVLWWIGAVVKESQRQHTATIIDLMNRHDAESKRRDERCDREHEKRDELFCTLSENVKELADELRARK